MREAGKLRESGARVGSALGTVPTARDAPAAGNVGQTELALLLAEAAASVHGAEARLASHLRPQLRSLLRAMLRKPPASGTTAMLADAGALVQALWRRSLHDDQDASGSAGAPDRAADATARALHLLYLEQAAHVMQGLTQSLAARSTPAADWGPALLALETLSVVEPRLGRIARLRWFAGLGIAEIAAMLSEAELDVQRAWGKARAYLAVAAATPAVPAATPAPKRRRRRADPPRRLEHRP